MTNHHNRNLYSRITPDSTLLADLEWDDHPDHHPTIQTARIVTESIRIERRRGAVTEVRAKPIELEIEASGAGMVVYASNAMEAAVRRSIKAGGGVRGISSAFLRPGEVATLKDGAVSVKDARWAWEIQVRDRAQIARIRAQ